VPASLPQGCPDEDTLLAFAEGQLVGEGLDAVVRHLESCDRCLGALGTSEKGYSSSAGRSSTAFRPGDLVAGRYEIRRFVARGGMGEVYEAHDRLVGARVALKTVLLASADIYAFGVVLFEAVTARLPFVASTPMATALKRLREPPPAPSTVAAGVHAGLEAIIMRCLARRPADRFASMRDVAAALDAIDRTVAMPRPLPRGVRVVWLGLGVVGAVGALAGSLILLREPTPAGRPSAPMNLPASDVVRAPGPTAATGTPAPTPTVLSSPAVAAAPVADAGSAGDQGPIRPAGGAAALTEKPRLVPRRTRTTPAAPTSSGKEPTVEKPRAEPVRPAQNGRSTSPLDGFADPYR
jgi:hypothetical protein